MSGLEKNEKKVNTLVVRTPSEELKLKFSSGGDCLKTNSLTSFK